MRERIVLVFNEQRVDRMVKNVPSASDLKRGEYYAVAHFEVHPDFFKPRPTPIIQIQIGAEHADEAPVVIDPAQQQKGTTERARQLGLSLRLFGILLDAARKSEDPGLSKAANDAFTELLENGVDVRLEDAAE